MFDVFLIIKTEKSYILTMFFIISFSQEFLKTKFKVENLNYPDN